MRMVITSDGYIQINGYGYHDCNVDFCKDMSWVPGYDKEQWGNFHALQWYGECDDPMATEEEIENFAPYGEIEFSKYPPPARIDELGVFEAAVIEYELAQKREQQEIEEQEKQMKEEEARLAEEEAKTFDSYLEFDLEDLLTDL